MTGRQRDAAVGRLPQTAAGGAHVVLVRPRRAADGGDRPAAARRSEAAPPQRAERPVRHIGRGSGAALRADDEWLERQRADAGECQGDGQHELWHA